MKMGLVQFLMVALVAILSAILVGCGGDEKATSEASGGDHFLKDQQQAIEKAKDVKHMLKDSALEQRKAIEQQSK